MKKRILALSLCLALVLTTGVVSTSAAQETGSLSFTTGYGTTDGATLTTTSSFDNATADSFTAGTQPITVDSATGLPYQLFEVDTGNVTSGNITLTLTAETIENERLALKVYNVTADTWDTVATAITEGQLTATVDAATYSSGGKLKAMSTVDYVANGSNRILWSTDQQHYTEFEDLNKVYMQIHEYMASEYAAGNVSYVINTGDIVDDPPSYATSAGQWLVADEAFSILDEADVPYGIVTGNHDVGDYPVNNYTNYLKYFDETRYEGKAWYGGSEDDNKCHYDLVTVGNVDLLILYIGYGLGDQQEVIDWANEVLAMYPHRNAILCTHQYLKPTTLEQAGRADILHNTIVSQNENVKMVLSGHYDGAAYKYREVDENRTVVEVIHDYQFVQVEADEYYADAEDPGHYIGSVPHCNGDGYIREVIIEGDTVSMFGFSPVTGGVTPFGARDDITLTVPFTEAQRSITTHHFSAIVGDSATAADYSTAETHTVYADADNLQALIDKARALEKSDYTKESYKSMKEVLKTAKKAVKSDSVDDTRAAYTNLANAIGELEVNEDTMDPEKLTTVADLNLDMSAWENTDGLPDLDSVGSYITFESLENGGFVVEKSSLSTIGWPAIKYTEPIVFTPEDGKVYLYLDLEAGSTWSCYPTVIQGSQQFMGRWNYIIEGAYKVDGDAGSGSYVGVYDITQALIDLGVDVNEQMTISFAMNIVPGPVTVNKISVLTGAYPEGFSLEDNWLWILLAAVVVLAIAVVLFALLYNPKKPSTPPAVNTADVDTATTEDPSQTDTE